MAGTVLTGQGIGVTPILKTFPTTPVFFIAYSSAGASNVTGTGTSVTVHYDTTTVNVGNAFNTSTFAFAAPYTGNYSFTAIITGTALANTYDLTFNLASFTGATPIIGVQNYRRSRPNGSSQQIMITNWMISLNATDTVQAAYSVSRVGANTCGYAGGITATRFTGYLIST